MTTTTPTISPLRQRMIDDMRLRKLADKTQSHYLRTVRQFSLFLGHPPDRATLEDLRRFGCSEESLLSGVEGPGFIELMKFEVSRAREYFRRALALFPHLDPESRQCPRLLMRFYSRILDKIESTGYGVLGRRIKLPWHEKIFLAGSAWIEARLGC